VLAEKVIIIGAPRSGTNMLRDILVELPGIGTWPCDEINYIWRHGNIRHPSDVFSPDMATASIRRYIGNQFEKIAKSRNLDIVIEKTCANSLRVGFVHRIVPDAKYIFIVRDGMDVVGSALRRWRANFDFVYTMRKAIYVPPTDIPYYGIRYMLNHMYRTFSREKRLAFWGPVIENVDWRLQKYSLPEVCALQWKSCVDNSERDLKKIPQHRVCRVKYEDFVGDAVGEFSRIAKFVEREVPGSVKDYITRNVWPSSVGKGRRALGERGVEYLMPLIADTLARYSYG
jgi:hypothetical protein